MMTSCQNVTAFDTGFSRSPLSRAELFQELGLESDAFLIGLIAELVPENRVRDAIWSCDQLKFAGLDFHTVVIGDGPDCDNLLRYRTAVQNQDRVHFLGRRVDISRLFSHFDLLWLPGQRHISVLLEVFNEASSRSAQSDFCPYESLKSWGTALAKKSGKCLKEIWGDRTELPQGQSSKWQRFSLSMPEIIRGALALEIPIFAADIPENRSLIRSWQNGLLIPEFGDDTVRRRTAWAHETLVFFSPEYEAKRFVFRKKAAERASCERVVSEL